jgi:hypothetical protein
MAEIAAGYDFESVPEPDYNAAQFRPKLHAQEDPPLGRRSR